MIKLIAVSLILLSCMAQPNSPQSTTVETTTLVSNDSVKNVYAFKVTSLDGKTIDFAAFKGKKILIVNTASECGFTPQYKELQELYEKYKEKLVIVGFPANNFGGQEPGTDTEIKSFCQKNYGVTFPMFGKVDVVGEGQAPLYKWLTTKSLNGWNDKAPTWNFCKYVIDEQGKLTNFFASGVKPGDAEFKKAVGI